jgi:hypothetical protein
VPVVPGDAGIGVVVGAPGVVVVAGGSELPDPIPVGPTAPEPAGDVPMAPVVVLGSGVVAPLSIGPVVVPIVPPVVFGRLPDVVLGVLPGVVAVLPAPPAPKARGVASITIAAVSAVRISRVACVPVMRFTYDDLFLGGTARAATASAAITNARRRAFRPARTPVHRGRGTGGEAGLTRQRFIRLWLHARNSSRG